MNRFKKPWILLAIWVSLGIGTLGAQVGTPVPQPLEIPIVVHTFDTSTLEPVWQDLGRRLAASLADTLQSLPPRPLWPLEAQQFSQYQAREAVKKSWLSVESATYALDLLGLQGATKQAMDSARKSLEDRRKEWQTLVEEMAEANGAPLETTPQGDGVFKVTLDALPPPIALTQGNIQVHPQEINETSTVLGEERPIILNQFETKGTWFSISGSIEIKGDVGVVSVALDHNLLGVRLFESQGGFGLDTLVDFPTQVLESLALYILGWEYSSLAIVSETPGTSATLEPYNKGQGLVWNWLRPGEYRVQINAPGFNPQLRLVNLAPGARARLTVALEPRDNQVVSIDANVTALVMDGVRPLGFTPLEVPRPDTETLFRLTAEDYEGIGFSLGPQGPPTLTFLLWPKSISKAALLDYRRDAMYGALGTAMVSLAIPFLFDALLINELGIYENSQLDPLAKNHIAARGNAYFLLRNAGYGISALFIVETIRRLVDYIDLAEEMDLARPLPVNPEPTHLE